MGQAELKIAALESEHGKHFIYTAKNIYQAWKTLHIPIRILAEKRGFDIDTDTFLIDYMVLRMEQETGVEMPRKRFRNNKYQYSIKRFTELHKKSFSKEVNEVEVEPSLITFSMIWAAKHGVEYTASSEGNKPTTVERAIEDARSKYKGLEFAIGRKVRAINLTKSDLLKYGKTTYIVQKQVGFYVYLVNSFGRVVKRAARNYEYVDQQDYIGAGG